MQLLVPLRLLLLFQKSTSNYHARRFGVRAAMPGFIAKKLCPGLIIVPTNFDKYRAVSEEVRTGRKHTNNTIFIFLLLWKLMLMSLNVSIRFVRFLLTMILTSCQWAWMKLIWISLTTWSRDGTGQNPLAHIAIAAAALPQAGMNIW